MKITLERILQTVKSSLPQEKAWDFGFKVKRTIVMTNFGKSHTLRSARLSLKYPGVLDRAQRFLPNVDS